MVVGVGTLKMVQFGGGCCVVLLGSPSLPSVSGAALRDVWEERAQRTCCLILPPWIPTGETGAAYLFLPLWDIPVQQRQGERGEAHSGTDVLCVVAASGRQQGFQKPPVFLSVRSRMYPSGFLSEQQKEFIGGDIF